MSWQTQRRQTRSSIACSRGDGSNQSSANSSPVGSPNRFNALRPFEAENTTEGEDKHCERCKDNYTLENDKFLECHRCFSHYCITCLGKTEEAYNMIIGSDLMWFCVQCREKVEKNIVTDRKIEETCKAMMSSFEKRIADIENAVASKCSIAEAKDLINEEINKRLPLLASHPQGATGDKQESSEAATATPPSSNVNEVLSEMNERKARENNIVMYGVAEVESKPFEERQSYDKNKAEEIISKCGVTLEKDEVRKTLRLGKYDKKSKKHRPMLVVLHNADKKKAIFKGGKTLRENESFKHVSLSNDLTPAERDLDKKLFEEAKEREKNQSGEYTFKVRGPPWARRIVRFKTVQVEPPSRAALEEETGSVE